MSVYFWVACASVAVLIGWPIYLNMKDRTPRSKY